MKRETIDSLASAEREEMRKEHELNPPGIFYQGGFSSHAYKIRALGKLSCGLAKYGYTMEELREHAKESFRWNMDSVEETLAMAVSLQDRDSF